ncbi:MAG TPA: hypothetical protein VEB00_07810 [Clostridia bacterium]|nr:hypothetical protein [Clostridia bacterium]
MFSVATNLFIFAAYFVILIIELIFMKIFDFDYSTPWLVTTLLYIMVIAYQVLARTNEYLEKGKVREILYRILDTVNGIPLLNKEDKIIIQWDVIFKKLIDKKEYFLYDNIIKTKTKTIDRFVNQYPSLLFDSSMDMIERNNRIDTNSFISGRGDKSKEEIKDIEITDEIKNKLFIKYLSSDKVTLANFDSSIYIDMLMSDEYEPQDYEKFGVKPDSRYDGFSILAFHKDQKYVVVPRTMVFNKRIDKEKWLYRNIAKIMQCAESIASGTQSYGIVIDELSLQDVLYDYVEIEKGRIPEFHFECIEDNLLIFSGIEYGKELARASCSLVTSHNGFEIKLIRYELIIDGVSELVEDEKTVVIGNAYQPLVTIMEKMPIITNNIRMAISKKDIEDLVIK